MIIGISGYARSGKDTIAQYLVESHGFTRMAFADPMREALYRLNPSVTVSGVHGVPLASVVETLGWERLKEISPDVRVLLQRMGTEVGRGMFGQDLWVDYLMKKAENATTDIVIPDVRFVNEAEAIKNAGGTVIRVNRPGVEAVNDHISEHELDGYNFNIYLDNVTTIEGLCTAVDALLPGIARKYATSGA